MNTIKLIVLFSLPILFFTGCDNATSINSSETIIGSGKVVTQTRIIPECSSIILERAGIVYLTQDTSKSVLIEADDNVMDNVLLNFENGVLTTGLENGSYSNITLRIYVPINSLNGLSIIGAGNIIVQEPIICDDLSCSIEGAGYIYVEGTGNTLNCLVNGSGRIDAEDFKVGTCKATINGFGNCAVYAVNELDASIIGSGIIYFYGKPPIINTTILGTGQIINLNNSLPD
jgi:Putative auto-transporter adhesin, head GIN domain